jgi:hypothetical protein
MMTELQLVKRRCLSLDGDCPHLRVRFETYVDEKGEKWISQVPYCERAYPNDAQCVKIEKIKELD